MDTELLTLIQNPGWGILALVIILVIKYPSFLSELTKLFDRLSKPKEPLSIEYGNFTLLKLERTRPEAWIVKWSKTLSTIFSGILIIGFSILYYLTLKTPPEVGVISSLSRLFSFVFFWFLPIIMIIDNYKIIRSSVDLELDGNFESLLRFCLKLLFDTKATITKFDAEGHIVSRLYGNEITIKIEPNENSRNKFSLISNGRVMNTLIYSVEYRRAINNIIRSLCYQEKVN